MSRTPRDLRVLGLAGARRRACAAASAGLALAVACLVYPAASEELAPNPQQPPDEVLTLEEAAALLKVSAETLEALVRAEQVPGRLLGADWRFSRAGLLEWLRGDAPRSDASRPRPLSDEDLRGARARGPDGEPEEPETVGERPPNEAASDIFLRSRRVLLAPRQLVIEPLVFYTRADTPDIQFQSFASADGLPIAVAVGDASNIEQNITTASLTGRYGLFEGIEAFGGLIFQDRRIHSSTESDISDTELRSVFLGLRATVLDEARYRPDVVVGVQGIAPTGDSSAGINANVFAVKSADPLAFFAGVDYLHTFSRDFDEAWKLEPEDTFAAQVGYVFAITDQTSINTSLQGIFVLDSSFDAGSIDSNEEFSLRFGLTQRLREDLFVEPSVAFSLDGPGDFVTFGLRFPWIALP